MVVVHDSFDSMGLGEAPPTSREITVRVRNRCER